MGRAGSIPGRWEGTEEAAAVQAQQKKPEHAQAQADTETSSKAHQDPPRQEARETGNVEPGKDPGDHSGNGPDEREKKDAEKPTNKPGFAHIYPKKREHKHAEKPTDKRDSAQKAGNDPKKSEPKDVDKLANEPDSAQKTKDALRQAQRDAAYTAFLMAKMQVPSGNSMQCEQGDTPQNFSDIQDLTTTLPDMTPTNDPPNCSYIREEAIAPLQNMANELHQTIERLEREHEQARVELGGHLNLKASWEQMHMELEERLEKKDEECKELETVNAYLRSRLRGGREYNVPAPQDGTKRKRDEDREEVASASARDAPRGNVKITVEGKKSGDVLEVPGQDDYHTGKKRKLDDEKVTLKARKEEAPGAVKESIEQKNGKKRKPENEKVTLEARKEEAPGAVAEKIDQKKGKKRKLDDEKVTKEVRKEEAPGPLEEKIDEQKNKKRVKRTKTATPTVATRKQPPRHARKDRV